MENVVIINEANLEEIEAKLEDGKYYWVTDCNSPILYIIKFIKGYGFLEHGSEEPLNIKYYITIIPIPITPPPLKLLTKEMKYTKEDVREYNVMVGLCGREWFVSLWLGGDGHGIIISKPFTDKAEAELLADKIALYIAPLLIIPKPLPTYEDIKKTAKKGYVDWHTFVDGTNYIKDKLK